MGRLLSFLRSGRGLSAYAGTVLGWMILVILWGAVVRATGSGAGCGDHWPLCNGDWIPQHPRLATIIEFTHRSMSGICTGLVGALIAWTVLAHEKGTRVRKAAVWSGVLLITEALLGAVLVLGGYVEHNTSDTRVLVQCVHFTNTMLLLGALTLAWWWQRPRPSATLNTPQTSRRMARLSWFALGFTVLTGATGSVAALADTLFPSANLRSALLADISSSSPLMVRMRWMHPAAAAIAVLLVAVIALQLGGGRRRLLLSLLALQVVLGVADVLMLAPITMQVLHLLGADLFWIALVFTAADILQPVAERSSQAHRSASTQSPGLQSPGPLAAKEA